MKKIFLTEVYKLREQGGGLRDTVEGWLTMAQDAVDNQETGDFHALTFGWEDEVEPAFTRAGTPVPPEIQAVIDDVHYGRITTETMPTSQEMAPKFAEAEKAAQMLR